MTVGTTRDVPPDAVSYRIHEHTFIVPPDHRLPALRAAMPTYDAHLGWIVREIGRADPGGVFIDIGANVGDTAATLRSFTANPLLCIEGNPAFLPYLRANARTLGPSVALVEAFVEVDEIAALGLAYRSATGSGGFIAGDGVSDDVAYVRVSDLVRRAEADGASVTLLKTDTDGLDAFILRDYLRLQHDRAVLFFECDEAATHAGGPDVWDHSFATLRARGYALIVYDNHGLPMLFAADQCSAAIDDLRFYVRRQAAAGALRVHYLDVWAFPPPHRALFERLRAERETLFF